MISEKIHYHTESVSLRRKHTYQANAMKQQQQDNQWNQVTDHEARTNETQYGSTCAFIGRHTIFSF